MDKITEMQKKMYYSRGHNVKVGLVGTNKALIGKCVYFTQPLDNDPEMASIDVIVKESGKEVLYELFEEDIESIETVD